MLSVAILLRFTWFFDGSRASDEVEDSRIPQRINAAKGKHGSFPADSDVPFSTGSLGREPTRKPLVPLGDYRSSPGKNRGLSPNSQLGSRLFEQILELLSPVKSALYAVELYHLPEGRSVALNIPLPLLYRMVS